MAEELSAKRKLVRSILEAKVPKGPIGLSSDDAMFKTMTSLDTVSLVRWWADHPVGTKGANLTTCNAFVGWLAREIGAPPGSQLASNLLQLDLADKDVPGCWVWAGTGKMPRPGDFYAKPFVFKDGSIQKFGHVGVIYDVHDWLFIDTVDGGQGGRSAGRDFIRWNMNKMFVGGKVTGWVDIDAYFTGR